MLQVSPHYSLCRSGRKPDLGQVVCKPGFRQMKLQMLKLDLVQIACSWRRPLLRWLICTHCDRAEGQPGAPSSSCACCSWRWIWLLCRPVPGGAASLAGPRYTCHTQAAQPLSCDHQHCSGEASLTLQ